MTQRDERGYEVPFEGQSYATRSTQHQEVELSATMEGLEVRIEEGRGYMSQTCNTFIHTDILISLLERAGFTVTPPTPST